MGKMKKSMLVKLEWDADLGEAWMNPDNLAILLYTQQNSFKNLLQMKVIPEPYALEYKDGYELINQCHGIALETNLKDLGSYDTTLKFDSLKVRRTLEERAKEYVNHPSHYNDYSVEVIDMMVKIYGAEKVADWCEITAYKYRMRAGKKHDLMEDMKKEVWYLIKAEELRNA